MARINIKRYGPLMDTQIEFAPMVIMTGNSNLGKSYVNYLLYFLVRSTSALDLTEYFLSNGYHQQTDFYITIRDIQNWMSQRVEGFMRDFLNSPDLICKVEFELSDNHDLSFHIKCEEESNVIDQYNQDKEIVSSEPSKFLRILIDDKLAGLTLSGSSIRTSFLESAFSRELQKKVFGTVISQSLILPPARGAFVGENYTLKQSISSSVGMYRHFLRDYDMATTMLTKTFEKSDGIYVGMIQKLIGGSLFTKDGTQYLDLKGGKVIPLSAAASSVKELSPFLIMLQSLQSTSNPLSFCIEEPEAHLHPMMQIDLADLLASCRNHGMFFQMTSHSDYFVQRINQLLRLGDVYKTYPDLYKKLIKENNWNIDCYLSKDDVVCYYFSQEDADNNVTIEKLQIQEGVLPMKTFYDPMNRLTDSEAILNSID